MSDYHEFATRKGNLKTALKVCYSFYREWMNCCNTAMDEEPNSFAYHLADNRAYQTRQHLDKFFPKWMLEACYKMYMESQTSYKWQIDSHITENVQRIKRLTNGLELDDIPF